MILFHRTDCRSPMETEKERLGRRVRGQKRGRKSPIRPMLAGVTNRQNGATGARTDGNARRSEDRENGRSAFRPPMNGGGGGNRTHVRWTVLARPYEHSLRFIFARRKPAGGPLARRSGSPSRPFAPTMSNTVAASQKRPTPDTHRREPSPEMTVLPQSWQRRALPGCRDSRSRRVSGGVGVVPNRGG
jgi:hypothetical protein